MRVVADALRGIGNSDRVEELDGAGRRFPASGQAMHAQGFANLVSNREDRIERGRRLLEDEADVSAPDGAHVSFRQRQEIASLESDVPRENASGWAHQPHDG